MAEEENLFSSQVFHPMGCHLAKPC